MKTKSFKGVIMLFGLFRIRKDFAFWQELSGKNPEVGGCYANQKHYLERLEPWLQKWCTIKWIETEAATEPEICYH
jgi:hypothetical protein